jgi:hypothetical protein
MDGVRHGPGRISCEWSQLGAANDRILFAHHTVCRDGPDCIAIHSDMHQLHYAKAGLTSFFVWRMDPPCSSR